MVTYNQENQKITSNSAKIKDRANVLLGSLNEIKESYESKMPQIDYKGIDKIQVNNVVVPSKTEIQKQAIDSLNQYKTNTLNKIEQQYYVDKNAENQKLKQTQSDFVKDVQNLKQNTNSQLNNLYAKNIKQGILNSTITKNTQQQIQDAKDAQMGNLQNEYTAKLDSIKLKKNLIEQQKNVALSNFDIAYASKLNNQIKTLTTQYNQALKEVQDYQKQLDAQKAEIEADFDAQYGAAIKNLKQDMQRDMTYDTFVKLKDLSKAEAQEILNTTPQIKEYLGDWYSALNLWLKR